MFRAYDKRLILSLVLVFAILVSNAFLDFLNTRDLHRQTTQVFHSQKVLASLDDLMLDITNAETGQRGYLITGDPRYLAPYNAALVSVHDQIAKVRQLTVDAPKQYQLVRELEKTISAKLHEMQHVLDLNKKSPEAARLFVLTNKGEKLMAEIRGRIGRIEQIERDKLSLQEQQAHSTYGAAIKSGVTSSFAGLLMVVAFVFFWRRDLLARETSAALLHEQRERFRTTLSSIGDAVIATNREGKIQFLNPIAGALTGWSEEDAAARPLKEIFRVVDERNREQIEDPVAEALKSGRIAGPTGHTVLVRTDGNEKSIATTGAPIRDAGGNITGVVLIFRDVTRERKAERTDRLLASIVESSDDAIYAKNLEGTILSWNAGAGHIYGYSAAEAIGKNVSFLVPDDNPNEEAELLERIGRGERIAHYETARIRKDGSRVYVSISLSPLADRNGRITGASSLARDITARKTAEEVLKRTADELDRSNKELEQFAYVASHDLQEPLRTIMGYLQLLEQRYKGRLDEKADKYIAYAVEGADRMSSLIRDLLSYSRVNTRREAFQQTSSEEALEFAIRNLQSAIKQSGGSVTYDPLPVVHADKVQLTQLFQNLVGNAIKYRASERRLKVHVAAHRENGFWIFDVNDNGIGFDQQYANKIFLIFQRLHSRSKYTGTGIGLAICKRIVERHGGRIWGVGKPGKGSTFTFTIPSKE